jgi:hypothetical protein
MDPKSDSNSEQKVEQKADSKGEENSAPNSKSKANLGDTSANPKTEPSKSNKKRKIAISLTIILLVSLGLGGIAVGLSHTLQTHLGFIWNSGWHHLDNRIIHRMSPQSIIRIYVEAWHRIQEKMQYFQTIDQEVSSLRLQNLKLQQQTETARFERRLNEGEKIVRQKEIKLSQETGDKVGRVLSSITYELPKNLDEDQLYTLAQGYFQSHDNEKAAVIMSHLLSPTTSKFRTEQNLLMTGVSWYQINNFTLADSYFTEVLKNNDDSNDRTVAQARLWKALVAQKTNKKMKAQFWMKDLRDHHPQSSEAKWINARGSRPIEGKKHDSD